ncbi:MAG: deoxyuridine 5'-triphosphate nucleotidohydrolase [Firmicutes bacterium]|nr:deoxyuridine 5'-triphosphate nucleotidohydrolase [Bacillota bacterium]
MADIKIKYFHDELERLRYIDGKSDWIDLRAAETVELKKGDYYAIKLGVAMKLPEGYEAHVVPRSSTFKNYGLIMVNSVGIIDNTYCGPNDQFHMPVYATRDTVVNFNDRICQFRIMENQPKINFIEDDLEGEQNRGGFGSTGVE